MLTKEENILPLITAYLNKELSHEEQTALEEMLREEEYEKIFLEHVGTYRNYRQLHFADTVNVEDAWGKTSSQLNWPLQREEKTITSYRFSFNRTLKYAAILIVIMTGAYFLQPYFTEDQTLENAVKDENAVIITLADGRKKIINTGADDVLKNSKGLTIGRQHGNSLAYGENLNSQTIQFNTISVPYGKKFTLYLSDGTRVDLNAGSTLKYPEEFIKTAQNREVYFSGEAYFEVSKDDAHPFLVHSNTMEVKVLGTHFNFRSYTEEKSAAVALLEGAVEVKSKTGSTIKLKPDEMGILNEDDNGLIKQEVYAENYAAWVEGRLIFRKVPLDLILKALERHFNVEIENRSKILKKSLLNANFGNDNLEQVMIYLQDDFGLKYKVKNKKIILY
ncbi:FecR family protein [Flavobacterium pectinovorum]|uniref:FecR family protein n=1 Tax=Flavobacterium pectinovorum TaxID=29533 RepID=UPI001FACD25F|nr:FecR family protein [Flavobacterium pectinovorum]MCI9843579.1 FecR family protein [Flavobacterium pectinovorum]